MKELPESVQSLKTFVKALAMAIFEHVTAIVFPHGPGCSLSSEEKELEKKYLTAFMVGPFVASHLSSPFLIDIARKFPPKLTSCMPFNATALNTSSPKVCLSCF